MRKVVAGVILGIGVSYPAASLWAQAAGAAQPSSAQAALGAQSTRWVDAFERGDAATVASLFTENGIYAANTGQVFRGRAEIREGVAGWMTGPLADAQRRTGSKLDVSSQPLKFDVGAQLAYGLSRFTLGLDPANCVIDSGHTLAVWQRQPDGEWLIAAFIGNRDPAPPPNSCPQPERG